jgi:serine/threonine protein kinase/TolB-like protein/Tfp pilus assembly protein PilF
MELSALQMARMSRLLDEVLPLDEAARRLWLGKLATEDQDLESALRQALLAPDGSVAEVLSTLPKVESGPHTVAHGLKLGERVGPYALVRELGAGGMAEVWLAQRADGAYKREVALKLPVLARLRKDLALRFERERDILASLEHPNIARLYDAGVSGEGLPYLAMEFVAGQALTEWCDAHRLGLRERLKLFLQVLDAVQYAHDQHVIHRDLKPPNILVTQSGQVKLLDFGVAKLLCEVDEAQSTALTRMYGQALTPEYASPEQLRGEAVDAASDLYALGVVLYELLCGSRPYRLKPGASMAQLELAIASARVEKPSTQLGLEAVDKRATTREKLARRLRGDLDAIVLKAIARQPAERYSSAAALADDLQHYLSGEPVEARPDRFFYRLGKFVLRQRAGVAASTAGVVLVAASIGFVLTRVPLERSGTAPTAGLGTPIPDQAAGAAVSDQSIAVLPFVDLSEKRDQEYFSDGLAEELIDLLGRTANLRVIARTSSFQFKGRNEDMRAIARTLGVANLLEGSVRKAGQTIRVTAQLISAADGSHVWSDTYDRKLKDIFKVQDEICGTVVRALRVTLSRDTPRPEAVPRNIDAYNLLLRGKYFHDRFTKEDEERAIDLFQKAIRLEPGYARAWAALAGAYLIRATEGWLDSPEVGVAQARSAAERALQLDPKSAEAHVVRAGIWARADFNLARAKWELAQVQQVDRNNAEMLTEMGILAAGLGQLDDAIALYRQGLLRDPLSGRLYWVLGDYLIDAGRYDEAEVAVRKQLELRPLSAGGHYLLGMVFIGIGRYAEGLEEMQRETDDAWRHVGLPFAYWGLGRREEADTALERLKAEYANTAPFQIAEIYGYRDERDLAFTWLNRAYQERDAGLANHLQTSGNLKRLRGDPRYRALLGKLNLPH